MHRIDLNDTIVAISTPMGGGGIGIVRLSGPQALAIADKLFVAKNKEKPSSFKTYTLHYGWVAKKQKTDDEIIDEVLLSVMRAPKSYTAQDIVEINCHGGIVPLKAILNLAVDFGARLAEPGEFTKRAFLNGRMDLAQAEAVLDIVRAKTDAFLKVSVNQLKGELTQELETIRELLMDAYTSIEATVNFPEDDNDSSKKSKFSKQISKALKKVDCLLASSEHGRILKEGIKIVLCGKPNVGKSSLLNALLKHPRAIVTKIAGTTRDTIEETAQIKGIPLQLIDTAGILEPRDLIEQEAVKRSHMHISGGDVIVLILDASQKLTQEDRDLITNTRGKNTIVAINKSDLKAKIDKETIKKECKDKKIISISALKKTGINILEDAIVENVWHEKTIDTHGVLISNMRHIESLKRCKKALKTASSALGENVPLEIISEEIKQAVNHLDIITGRNIDIDLLDKIFSDFCIGK